MTRFARAKGSKSANERAPEDSTPWEVMKEQLLQAKSNNEEEKNREKAEKQRIENYENFLKEQKVKKRKAEWCDFPDAENKSKNKSISSPKKKKKNKSQNIEDSNNVSVQEIPQAPPVKKCKKQKNNNIINDQSLNTAELSENNESHKTKKNKKSKKKTNRDESTDEASPVTENNDKSDNQPQNIAQNMDMSHKKKKQKNKKAKSQANSENNQNASDTTSNNHQQNTKGHPNNQKQSNKTCKKLKDGQPTRRKPIQDRSFQLIINGKDVELVRFDGFPIMKKDADRLEELRKEMIKKGIPKSEVQRTLKLERRRAEKALARLKRDVCYNCRKGGHNLSDCPELKTKIPGVGAADGMCFKCGSTEHRQFECKVQKDKEFRFATCFICKEPGHIARQCPDNPKGLYPNGGSCKLCGDVTHLRKDCPTVHDKREEKSIKLQTLDSENNVEGIEQQNEKSTFAEQSKKPKKIKF